jgi:GTP cyclohydrolase IA
MLPDTEAVAMAEQHARAMLTALGLVDDLDEATRGTPGRVVRALVEMTAGRYVDPTAYLACTFPPEGDDDGMIVVPGIRFVSVCEHHLLPFSGTATVGYLPNPGARIVGLSKLARVVKAYAARPQVQERLGVQIVSALVENLDTAGAACVLRSQHTCMTLRGALAEGADMVTSHLRGAFKDDPTVRAEFLSLAR